ncbi:MAG: hypothetical protein GY906_24470 [bacterium]|nr:hypothetical protein [bacterium]
MGDDDETQEATYTDLLEQKHLLETPYVQGLLLLIDYPAKSWLVEHEAPFYYDPLKNFQEELRAFHRLPASSQIGL